VPEHFDPILIGMAFLVWPATKSLVFAISAAMSMWSRDERRRRAAERILRAFGAADESKFGDENLPGGE
jgi:hypothetical protein